MLHPRHQTKVLDAKVQPEPEEESDGEGGGEGEADAGAVADPDAGADKVKQEQPSTPPATPAGEPPANEELLPRLEPAMQAGDDDSEAQRAVAATSRRPAPTAKSVPKAKAKLKAKAKAKAHAPHMSSLAEQFHVGQEVLVSQGKGKNAQKFTGVIVKKLLKKAWKPWLRFLPAPTPPH